MESSLTGINKAQNPLSVIPRITSDPPKGVNYLLKLALYSPDNNEILSFRYICTEDRLTDRLSFVNLMYFIKITRTRLKI